MLRFLTIILIQVFQGLKAQVDPQDPKAYQALKAHQVLMGRRVQKVPANMSIICPHLIALQTHCTHNVLIVGDAGVPGAPGIPGYSYGR